MPNGTGKIPGRMTLRVKSSTKGFMVKILNTNNLPDSLRQNYGTLISGAVCLLNQGQNM